MISCRSCISQLEIGAAEKAQATAQPAGDQATCPLNSCEGAVQVYSARAACLLFTSLNLVQVFER